MRIKFPRSPQICVNYLPWGHTAVMKSILCRDVGENVTWLAECRTSIPLKQVWFPAAARDFFPPSQPSVQTLLWCPYSPVCNRMHKHLSICLFVAWKRGLPQNMQIVWYYPTKKAFFLPFCVFWSFLKLPTLIFVSDFCFVVFCCLILFGHTHGLNLLG